MIQLVTVRSAGCKRSGRTVPLAISFALGLFLLSSPLALQAENVRVDAKVSRDTIQIVDPFELEIRVVAPQGTQVSLPVTTGTFGPFEVLGSNDKFDLPMSDENVNDRLWVRIMSLETLEAGQLEIPTIEIMIKQVGQPEEILRTEPITINVSSVVEPTADLTKFKGIAGARDIEVPTPPSYRWIWLGAGAAAIAIGLAGGAFFLTTRSTATVSAKVWALKKLNTTHDLPEAEMTVRQFIEERFECAATSMPAAQMLAVLRSRDVKDSVRRDVRELLETSERAKFGGLDLPASEKARLLNLATQLVETLDQIGGQD